MAVSGLKSLPVLMHHYVSDFPNKIAVKPAVFDEQCRILAENGWRGVSLAEAEAFLTRGESLPPKSFLMTFDDGYLDNYVQALPIMRKYGHQGVIFAVADRISAAQKAAEADPSRRPTGEAGEETGRRVSGGALTVPRFTLDDLWGGRCRAEELPPVNDPMVARPQGYAVKEDLFFTWDEARLMEAGGVLSIAAHSLRHERVLTDDVNAGDFNRPGQLLRTFWHVWPEIFWGLPDFGRAPELVSRAFLLNPEFVSAVKELVPQDEVGAFEFFSLPENIERLRSLVAGFQGRFGEPESPEGRNRRIGGIMRANQEILERELGRVTRSFCWPWGLGDKQALELGREAGFQAFYTCDMGANLPGKPLAVNRFKVKSKDGSWLLNRLRIYASPLLAGLYAKFRI